MFIQTEGTPNPATLKFLPGRAVMETGTREFTSADEAQASPLASALFKIEAVSGVFFGSDFITVTKADGEWQQLKPAVLGAIMDHFTSGQPLLKADAEAAEEHAAYSGEDGEIVTQIKEILIRGCVRPLPKTAGTLFSTAMKTESCFLHMRGACAGCPASTMTLKSGIENMLRHYVPEVEEVRQIL